MQGNLGSLDGRYFDILFCMVKSQEILELSAGAEEGIGPWKKEGREEGTTVGAERSSL